TGEVVTQRPAARRPVRRIRSSRSPAACSAGVFDPHRESPPEKLTMASLMKLPGGRWRIQFVGTDGKRKTLRPGAMPKKAAESVKAHVEALLSAVLSDSSPDNHTAAWLGSIAPALRRKLVRVGLASPRIDEAAPPTVGVTVKG